MVDILAQAAASTALEVVGKNPAPYVVVAALAIIALRVIGDLITRALPGKDKRTCQLTEELVKKMDHHFHDSDRHERTTETIAATQQSIASTMSTMSNCLNELKESNRRIELEQARKEGKENG